LLLKKVNKVSIFWSEINLGQIMTKFTALTFGKSEKIQIF